MYIGRHEWRASVAAALLVVAALGACSDSGSNDRDTEATDGDGDTTAATADPAACPGEPLRFTSILRLSGPLAVESIGLESQQGIEVGLHAVNSECTLGRPLDIVVCDDASDPNEATRCGREAASDGSLALFLSSGTFDTGTTAAGLPGVLTAGASLFDLTDPNSFSAFSGLTLVVGGVSAAEAAGAENMLMVSVDTGAARAFVGIAQDIAEGLGVPMDTLFVPPETTDFAPVAAQIAERDPDAIGLILPSVVPFMNALEGEGISPLDTPVMTAVSIFSREVLDELGSTADGVYLLSQAVPPSQEGNPGVQQMLEEFADAGVEVDPASLSPTSTNAWASVHVLAEILGELPPAELESLDSASLVSLLSTIGPIERPELAPFDFREQAYPDIESIAGLRLFSREAMVVRVEDGGYVPVSGFSDATQPFDIES